MKLVIYGEGVTLEVALGRGSGPVKGARES